LERMGLTEEREKNEFMDLLNSAWKHARMFCQEDAAMQSWLASGFLMELDWLVRCRHQMHS
jgi:hypothetical protein